MLTNKIILITGATAGFGEATARRAVAEGARVIATGRRQERLGNLKKGDYILYKPNSII